MGRVYQDSEWNEKAMQPLIAEWQKLRAVDPEKANQFFEAYLYAPIESVLCTLYRKMLAKFPISLGDYEDFRQTLLMHVKGSVL
jgi:hypothetical protein